MANDAPQSTALAHAGERLYALEQAVEDAVDHAVEATEQSIARRFGAGCVRGLRFSLKALFFALVIGYFAFGVLLLGARHWLMPRIDQARPWLEQQVGAALKTGVRIGRIDASWLGFNLRLRLADVRLLAGGGEERLALPQIDAVVSWTSVPRLGLRFASLSVLAPEVEVRRLGPARFEIAGFVFEPKPDGGEGGGLLDWVFSQPRISVRDARIVYTDVSGAGVGTAGGAGLPAPQVFTDVSLRFEAGLASHRFALQARPPAALASLIDVRGDFTQRWLQRPADFSRWRGRLFAQVDYADLGQLERLARVLPGAMRVERAQGALRAWLDVDGPRVEKTTADVALVDVRATWGEGLQPLEVDTVRGRFTQSEWGGPFLGGQQLALVGLSMQGPRLDLPPTDLRYRSTRADDAEDSRRPPKAEFEASVLSLDTLTTLAVHVPLARDLRQLIARYAARGTLTGLRLAVDGPLDRPQQFSLRSRFSGLALQGQPADPLLTPRGRPRPGVPGFANLAGQLEATERGGTATVDARAATLEFPGVFEDPRLAFDRVTAQVRWTRTGDAVEVQFDSLAASNADVELSAGGSYRREGDGPGSIDLSGRLARADIAAVPRYVPLIAGAQTRAWLALALLGGRASDGSFRLRGNLRDFPFRDARSGEFRVAVRTRDAVLDYLPAALPRDDGGPRPPWPRIGRIDADVVFDRQSLEVTARSATVFTTQLAPVTARVADLNAPDPLLQLRGASAGPAADLLRFVADSPLKDRLPILAAAGASGPARLDLSLDIPLSHAGDVHVAGNVQLQNSDITLRDDVPPFTRVNGRIGFTGSSLQLAGITAGFVGGLARIDGGTRADGAIVVTASGTATPAGARRAVDVGIVQRLLARTTGTTRYAGTLTLRGGRPELRIDTDLAGWAIDVPAPFAKSASEVRPLRIELLPEAGSEPERDIVRVSAGTLLNLRFERVRSAPGEMRVERGVVAVGEPAPVPARGVLAHINVARLDADQWLPLLDTDVPAAAGGAEPSAAVASAIPEYVNLRARELLISGKPFASVVAGATRVREAGETMWLANVASDHVSGALTWRPATPGSSGRVSARLTRLAIPEAQRAQVAQILDAPTTDVPGFDVVADSFELAGRTLGRLELVASNVATPRGPAWVMQKLAISTPEAQLNATGQWQREAGATQRTMAMKLKLDFSNGGALLARLGIPEALRGGEGQLEGDLSWRGSPFSIHYPTLSGQLGINTSKGQFLKASAGAGRLLGVLSLQSLPRRISLDFRDVFSEGFAFDSISGNAGIRAGVLTTADFRMRGVNANVLIEGSVDLRDETQNLHVLVLPEVNAGSASLVYALMANPAIGLGTFLAQLLLRDPLSKAFSFEYDVTGPWSDPQVKRREKPAPGPAPAGGN